MPNGWIETPAAIPAKPVAFETGVTLLCHRTAVPTESNSPRFINLAASEGK